ncbi:MAG: hypothetical protein Q9216_001961 [Gyalolechia sp. 2 TL-2023]
MGVWENVDSTIFASDLTNSYHVRSLLFRSDVLFAVLYKDGMFVIRRNDRDILVTSNKYVDELRTIPEEKLSGVEADVQNLRGPYYLPTILRSNLHTRSLNQQMSPHLQAYVDLVRDELDYAVTKELPDSDEWTEAVLGELLLRLVARTSARFIVGLPLCRDEEWLRVSTVVGTNVFTQVLVLRLLPRFLQPLEPIVVRCLPMWYRLRENLDTAYTLLKPIITNVRARDKSLLFSESDESPPLLHWMAENGRNNIERDPVNVARRQIFLGLGSIHTTASAANHAIHDLCAHPELLDPLRQEIQGVMEANNGNLEKQDLAKLWKLDSFLSESQRVNPPFLTLRFINSREVASFHRLALEPITLSDGTHLPRGTFVAIPSASILYDPSIVPDPYTFDAFRNYRKRLEPGQSTRHQYAMVDKEHMHFGHGKHACPGRALAANELKLIVARLVMDYEMKYPAGKGRPKNLMINEFVIGDMFAKVMIKRRKKEEENALVPQS